MAAERDCTEFSKGQPNDVTDESKKIKIPSLVNVRVKRVTAIVLFQTVLNLPWL
ncbi:hypothetical protein X975_21481, partial [Stegodyphus mimosarum]